MASDEIERPTYRELADRLGVKVHAARTERTFPPQICHTRSKQCVYIQRGNRLGDDVAALTRAKRPWWRR
jgi:hypothetical protein